MCGNLGGANEFTCHYQDPISVLCLNFKQPWVESGWRQAAASLFGYVLNASSCMVPNIFLAFLQWLAAPQHPIYPANLPSYTQPSLIHHNYSAGCLQNVTFYVAKKKKNILYNWVSAKCCFLCFKEEKMIFFYWVFALCYFLRWEEDKMILRLMISFY